MNVFNYSFSLRLLIKKSFVTAASDESILVQACFVLVIRVICVNHCQIEESLISMQHTNAQVP